jgi:hypothetical protein
MVFVETGKDHAEVLCILEFVVHDERGISISLHIFLKVQVVLKYIVDQPTQKSNIRTNTNRGIDVSHLRCAGEVWINMNDGRTTLFCRHRPTETDRVTFGKVAGLYQNAVAIV